jgi:hypothetical protein
VRNIFRENVAGFRGSVAHIAGGGDTVRLIRHCVLVPFPIDYSTPARGSAMFHKRPFVPVASFEQNCELS